MLSFSQQKIEITETFSAISTFVTEPFLQKTKK